MGKINIQHLDEYEDEYVPYEPIKKKKKKVSPIYNKDSQDELDN